jgi:hypothetical protein
LHMGASSYLVKPLDRDRMAELIEKYRAEFGAGGSQNMPVGAGVSSGKTGTTHSQWDSRARRN